MQKTSFIVLITIMCVHVFQKMYGCQWDGITRKREGFQMYGYDGMDFISLDLNSMTYTAPVIEALQTKQSWDCDKAQLEYSKQYLTKDCVDWLQTYLQFGKSILERKVSPEVSLFQKGSSSSDVVCHATGFYPEGVMITWKRNGVEMQEDIDVGETLPNADGTFQKRVILTVSFEEWKKNEYTCEVTHSGGEFIAMILSADEISRSDPNTIPLGLIIGVVVGLLVVNAALAVFVVRKQKKKSVFVRAESDVSSQGSDEALVKS